MTLFNTTLYMTIKDLFQLCLQGKIREVREDFLSNLPFMGPCHNEREWEKAENISDKLYEEPHKYFGDKLFKSIGNSISKGKNDPKRVLSAVQIKVLEYIESNGGCSVPEIHEDTGIPCKSLERHISVLRALGFLEHTGSKKSGGYYVINRRK